MSHVHRIASNVIGASRLSRWLDLRDRQVREEVSSWTLLLVASLVGYAAGDILRKR